MKRFTLPALVVAASVVSAPAMAAIDTTGILAEITSGKDAAIGVALGFLGAIFAVKAIKFVTRAG